ncbi:MAG: hypothetical protein ACF8XB_07090 [Planctomycetota bacterium JB042]
MSLLRSSILAAFGLSAAGCLGDGYEATTPIPHVTYERAPGFPPGDYVAGASVVAPTPGVTVGQRIAEFCTAVAAHGGPSTTVAALPVVTYEMRRDAPWVSELGVRLADEIVQRLRDAGYRGPVWTTRELDLRVSAAGIDKASLATLGDVVDHGPALGARLVTFGTLKRENDVGRTGRDLLTLSLTAVDTASRTEAAHLSIEVPSDADNNRTFFELAKRESLWLSAGE